MDGFPRRHARPRRARAASPRAAGVEPRWRGADREAHPGRGRARRRQLGRGDRAPPRQRGARASAAARRARTSSAAALGADVPFFLAQGPQLGTGDGTELAAARACRRTTGSCSSLPARGDASRRRPTSTRRFDERGGDAGLRGPPRRACSRRSRASGARATSPRCPPNDLASSPLADELRAPRRLPRRRDRRRPGGLRPLHAGARPALPRATRSAPSGGPGSRCLLGTVDARCLQRPYALEHGSTRHGRWLRAKRLWLALWLAVDRGHPRRLRRHPAAGSRWSSRCSRSASTSSRGARARHDAVRQVSWIAAASQASSRSCPCWSPWPRCSRSSPSPCSPLVALVALLADRR